MIKVEYFGASWCGQCRVFRPRFEEVCAGLGIELSVHDVEDEESLAQKYGIRNVPYVIVLRDEEVIDRGMAADILSKLKDYE